jgi:protein TonB
MTLEESSMDFSEYERNPGKRFTGIAFVIFLHVFIVYALVTGLARKVVEVIKQPIETKIIEEVKPPPPPDLPPPPPPPKLLAPPPPFIPPPEVQVQQPPPQQTITAVSNVKPDNPVMPQVVRTDGPPATGPVLVPAVVDAKNCEKPEYPRNAQRNGNEGTVTLSFLIGIDGRVVESKVEKTSGFRDLDKAAQAGLSLCKFKPGTIDGKPQQSWTKIQYAWKLVE